MEQQKLLEWLKQYVDKVDSKVDKVDAKLDSLNDKVDDLLKFKWQVMGGTAAVSILIAVFVQLISIFIK